MDVTPRKEEPAPEKPLELDTTVGSASNGNGNQKKNKPSKFKSIFTKSSARQSNSYEIVAPISDTQQNANKDTVGKGDNLSFKGPAKTFLADSSTNVFLVRDVEKPNNATATGETVTHRHENVLVDVHNSSEMPIKDHQNNVYASSNQGRQRPQSHSRERKKEVTICESRETNSFNQTQRIPTHGMKSSRRNPVGSSSCTRSSSGQFEKSTKFDLRSLKRQNRDMRRKNTELLSFVEELTENCEYYKSTLMQKETNQEVEKIHLSKEVEAQNRQIIQLGQEIDAWREKCQQMENKSTALLKVKNLSLENKDLLADVEVHKSVIIRLNKELAYYQDKLRVKFKDTPENIPIYSSGTDTEDGRGSFPEDGDWIQDPRKKLLPLLIAYDEVIAEKEDLIKDHEITLDRFKGKCMEIVKENEALHQLISSNKERGSISIDEWESLRSNAVIVLEENDILHEQADNLKKKEEKLFATFQVKAAEFKQSIAQHEAEINRQKTIITELESKCKQLSDEHTSMAATVHARIPREKHEAMVQEFKRAFDELKSKYETDKTAISDKLVTAEKERGSLAEEFAMVDNQNTHLRRDIQELERNLGATTEALEQMKLSLLETTSTREATNRVIDDFVKHIQQLAAEKNQLLEDLNQQRLLNEQMMALRSKENDLVKQLHDKIEAMERLHNDEVKSIQSRVKELEEGIRAKSERHRRELLQYSELLEEKDRRIEGIEESKKQLTQDLETVWRTTTTTMNASLKNRNV